MAVLDEPIEYQWTWYTFRDWKDYRQCKNSICLFKTDSIFQVPIFLDVKKKHCEMGKIVKKIIRSPARLQLINFIESWKELRSRDIYRYPYYVLWILVRPSIGSWYHCSVCLGQNNKRHSLISLQLSRLWCFNMTMQLWLPT